MITCFPRWFVEAKSIQGWILQQAMFDYTMGYHVFIGNVRYEVPAVVLECIGLTPCKVFLHRRITLVMDQVSTPHLVWRDWLRSWNGPAEETASQCCDVLQMPVAALPGRVPARDHRLWDTSQTLQHWHRAAKQISCVRFPRVFSVWSKRIRLGRDEQFTSPECSCDT